METTLAGKRRAAAYAHNVRTERQLHAAPREVGTVTRSSVIAGLDPAIRLWKDSREQGWMRGPSPRRSGYGRAGGSSPRLTRVVFVTPPPPSCSAGSSR